MRISIIIPVLNEEPVLVEALPRWQTLRRRGCEIIVADGGSRDRSAEVARAFADGIVLAPQGRAKQMNLGARAANGEILWFLHADSQPPAGADGLIHQVLAEPGVLWGRFDVRLSGDHPLLRLVETLMNIRSRLTAIATGDQGIFVRRESFEQAGGYPEIPLMEDIALSRVLKRASRPACLRQCLTTSSRRWERNGILRTILLMWGLRLAYFLGASPARLARLYYGG